MKKARTVITLVLALAMALSLAACGKGSGDAGIPDNPDNNEHQEFVYTAEFKPLDLDTDSGVTLYCAGHGGAYIGWAEKTGEGDGSESRIGFVDFEGNVRTLEKYRSVPKIENTENKREFSSYSGICGVYPISDGKLLALETRRCNWNEAPEGTDMSSGSNANFYQNIIEYYIRVLSADGSELSSSLIDIAADILQPSAVAATADGRLIVPNDTSIAVIGQDGSIVSEIPGGNDTHFDRVIALKDGTVAATIFNGSGLELLPVDIEEKKLGEAVNLPDGGYSIYSGGGDYDLYYNNGIDLCGFDLDSGGSRKLLSWMDCDISDRDMSGLSVTSDGRIVAALDHWSYNRYGDAYSQNTGELVVVSRVPSESAPQKTELTLAVLNMEGSDLSNAIVRFNRGNNRCHISVRDYSEYNTAADDTAGLTKLTTEIMAGNLPDLLLFSGQLPYEQYAAKGILEDLYPYIDADPELSREDFFPTVMAAIEVDGKLCQAAGGFRIESVLGPKNIVGDTPGWTYEQYNEALAKMPAGCSGFDAFLLQSDMLRSLLAVDYEYYVNWTAGECKFDSPEFIRLLEFTASFPTEIPADYEWGDAGALIAEGKQMLTFATIYDFYNILYNDFLFGPGNSTYIGYPSSDGEGNLFEINSGIAITKDCADKDSAWQFVRGFLTEKGQNELHSDCLPTNIRLFDRYLEQAMTPNYEKDADGNFILDENGERIPAAVGTYRLNDGTMYQLYAVTQEQADNLKALINNTTKLANYNDSIFDIVSEQAAAFFAGQKSAEEVARLIQSKANIYVNEQR